MCVTASGGSCGVIARTRVHHSDTKKNQTMCACCVPLVVVCASLWSTYFISTVTLPYLRLLTFVVARYYNLTRQLCAHIHTNRAFTIANLAHVRDLLYTNICEDIHIARTSKQQVAMDSAETELLRMQIRNAHLHTHTHTYSSDKWMDDRANERHLIGIQYF